MLTSPFQEIAGQTFEAEHEHIYGSMTNKDASDGGKELSFYNLV